MFTQSSLLASVFEVVDFLVVGGRGLLLVGCGDLSYDLYYPELSDRKFLAAHGLDPVRRQWAQEICLLKGGGVAT